MDVQCTQNNKILKMQIDKVIALLMAVNKVNFDQRNSAISKVGYMQKKS